MHHQPYGVRSVIEDRDLSRAASERYLMLQALTDRRAARDRRNTGWRRGRLHRLLNRPAPAS
jgi:hypothetical protein